MREKSELLLFIQLNVLLVPYTENLGLLIEALCGSIKIQHSKAVLKALIKYNYGLLLCL